MTVRAIMETKDRKPLRKGTQVAAWIPTHLVERMRAMCRYYDLKVATFLRNAIDREVGILERRAAKEQRANSQDSHAA